MKNALIVGIMMCLVGCVGVVDSMNKMAGVGVVSVDQSSFDDSTTVSVTPSWTYEKGAGGKSVRLGARWTSAVPDYAVIVMEYSSSVGGLSYGDAYIRLTGIDVSIDGAERSFVPGRSTKLDSSDYNTISESIFTTSTNHVVVPLEYLTQMTAAQDCRVRVHTSEGYEDSHFSIERMPGGQATAIVAIKEFLQTVETLNI